MCGCNLSYSTSSKVPCLVSTDSKRRQYALTLLIKFLSDSTAARFADSIWKVISTYQLSKKYSWASESISSQPAFFLPNTIHLPRPHLSNCDALESGPCAQRIRPAEPPKNLICFFHVNILHRQNSQEKKLSKQTLPHPYKFSDCSGVIVSMLL